MKMIISLPNELLQLSEFSSYRHEFTKVKQFFFRKKSFFLPVFFVILSLFLANSGCSSSPRFKRSYNAVSQGKHFGTTSTTNNTRGRSQTGMASYYGKKFHGRKTANGETYNRHELTAAHRKLPFNTKVKVTNLENGHSVIVRINDRGPFAKRRIIDLSEGAAKRIDMIKNGIVKVRLEVLK